jgi:hypothetical protein
MSKQQHDLLLCLWEVYLCMRTWNTSHFGDLPKEMQGDFRELVESKKLFVTVENCKRAIIGAGAEVRDSWLSPLCAAAIERGEDIGIAQRDSLGRIMYEMYPLLVRLGIIVEKPRRGRRPDPDVDPKRDEMVYQAMRETGSREDVARQYQMTTDGVKAAQDRHRKRRRN